MATRAVVLQTGAMLFEGVFMFADDGVSYYPSAEDAAVDMEWVDVEGGAYEAMFTVRAERLVPHPLDKYMVRLEPSGEVDIDSLTSMLRRERDRRGTLTADPNDPPAVAQELDEQERAWRSSRWSRRWPKRPRWLDKRLHGEGPAEL
jgi:hypothetical protein